MDTTITYIVVALIVSATLAALAWARGQDVAERETEARKAALAKHPLSGVYRKNAIPSTVWCPGCGHAHYGHPSHCSCGRKLL